MMIDALWSLGSAVFGAGLSAGAFIGTTRTRLQSLEQRLTAGLTRIDARLTWQDNILAKILLQEKPIHVGPGNDHQSERSSGG